jgi:hypothetical protein
MRWALPVISKFPFASIFSVKQEMILSLENDIHMCMEGANMIGRMNE